MTVLAAALQSKPMRVYLSYDLSDREFVAQVRERLIAGGVDVWNPETKLQPGSNWLKETGRALERADAIVFILSRRALRSPYMQKEIDYDHEAAGEPGLSGGHGQRSSAVDPSRNRRHQIEWVAGPDRASPPSQTAEGDEGSEIAAQARSLDEGRRQASSFQARFEESTHHGEEPLFTRRAERLTEVFDGGQATRDVESRRPTSRSVSLPLEPRSAIHATSGDDPE
jgi:hypothetical protein